MFFVYIPKNFRLSDLCWELLCLFNKCRVYSNCPVGNESVKRLAKSLINTQMWYLSIFHTPILTKFCSSRCPMSDDFHYVVQNLNIKEGWKRGNLSRICKMLIMFWALSRCKLKYVVNKVTGMCFCDVMACFSLRTGKLAPHSETQGALCLLNTVCNHVTARCMHNIVLRKI